MQQKNKQASALVVSMIILGLVLSIALSVSLVSILENKASTGSSKSNLAYSRADTGVEAVLKLISDNIGGTIDAIDGNCDGIIVAADGKYKIELKDGDDKIISADNGYDCSSEKVSTIDVIKSTGITSTNQRSVEVAVKMLNCGIGQVADADGNKYDTVLIGDQCWMASNLNVGARLASGATLPTNNGIIEKWCFDNNNANCTSDGGLYHWNEAMQYVTTPGAQGVCPTGWHVPTDAQQNTLDQYLTDYGQTCNAARVNDWSCLSAGSKLSASTLNGNNSSGFTGVLAGYRNTYGDFANRASDANVWSSSQDGASSAWYRLLYSGGATVNRYADAKAHGFSVRCLKD